MVLRLLSLPLRVSGDSPEDSGVVPQDESSACDIEEAGDPIDVVDCWRAVGGWVGPFLFPTEGFWFAPFGNEVLLSLCEI